MKCFKINLKSHNVIIEGVDILHALAGFKDEPLDNIKSISAH